MSGVVGVSFRDQVDGDAGTDGDSPGTVIADVGITRGVGGMGISSSGGSSVVVDSVVVEVPSVPDDVVFSTLSGTVTIGGCSLVIPRTFAISSGLTGTPCFSNSSSSRAILAICSTDVPGSLGVTGVFFKPGSGSGIGASIGGCSESGSVFCFFVGGVTASMISYTVVGFFRLGTGGSSLAGVGDSSMGSGGVVSFVGGCFFACFSYSSKSNFSCSFLRSRASFF